MTQNNVSLFLRVSNRQLVGVVHAAEQVHITTMMKMVENTVDEDDLHYLDHEISLQDLEQQLLLELRDPVGTMAVHRQLVEVKLQHQH